MDTAHMDKAALLAAAVTAVVGVYFLLGRDILARFGLADPVAPWWALLLLAPAGLLAYRAQRAAQRGTQGGAQGGAQGSAGQSGARERREVWVLGLGAAVLVILAAYLAELVPHGVVWPAVMVAGLAYATGRAVLAAVRRG